MDQFGQNQRHLVLKEQLIITESFNLNKPFIRENRAIKFGYLKYWSLKTSLIPAPRVKHGPILTKSGAFCPLGALVEDNDILLSIINILMALISLNEGLIDLKLGVSSQSTHMC